MRVDSTTVTSSYQATMPNAASSSKETASSKSTANNKTNSKDVLELSTEGKDALKNSDGKDYDLAKVMAIHKKGFSQIPTREESDYYWNARRNDPALDAQLYAQDKAEALKEVGKVQTILMKAMRGEKLTPEEEEMVKNDPALAQEVAKRKMEGESFKNL